MANVTLTGQKPAILDCNKSASIRGDFDPVEVARDILVKPVFEPINNGQVKLTVDGLDLDEDAFTDIVANTLDDNFDQVAEDTAREIFERALIHFDNSTSMNIRRIFANQAGHASKLQMPSARVIYTADGDVIPAAKEFLTGVCTFDKWFASLAFFAHPTTLGVSCMNEDTFDKFKEWADNQVSMLAQAQSIPPETTQKFSSFMKDTSLSDLTESILVRKDMMTENEEGSFPRVITKLITKYALVDSDNFQVMAFDATELICPTSIIFVNVDAHAHATKKQVSEEWDLIRKSLTSPVKVITTGKINKLTVAARTAKKIQAATALAVSKQQGDVAKAANVKFRKRPPSHTDLIKRTKKIIEKMSNVARSENAIKFVKSSYARANRRHPDDFNLPGKVVSTKFKPDLHIYLDTSGSISEENYEDMIKACIQLARKTNVNLYFNSFSHYMSNCTFLPVKGRSAKQIYKQFQKIPKVTGGTDYLQIWDYINASPKRRRELSIIMTDMEFSVNTRAMNQHPENLYYVPCSRMNWDWLVQNAQMFINSAKRLIPDIRKHILM